MERIRQRLLDESSGIKKSEDARKQRDLKKYGKKVQTAKLQEREGERRALDDRLKTLKRSASPPPSPCPHRAVPPPLTPRTDPPPPSPGFCRAQGRRGRARRRR